MVSKAERPVLVWRAAADQISHAHELRALRTLCGQRIVDHRLAWPPQVKCPDCLSASGQKAVPMAS